LIKSSQKVRHHVFFRDTVYTHTMAFRDFSLITYKFPCVPGGWPPRHDTETRVVSSECSDALPCSNSWVCSWRLSLIRSCCATDSILFHSCQPATHNDNTNDDDGGGGGNGQLVSKMISKRQS